MWKKGNPSTLLVRMQTGAATVENSMEFPQKLKVVLPFDPAIPLLGIRGLSEGIQPFNMNIRDIY